MSVRRVHTPIITTLIAGTTLLSLSLAGTSTAAPVLPGPGTSCSPADFWKDYRVTTESKGSKLEIKHAPSAKNADWLTCIPHNWLPDQVKGIEETIAAFGTWTLTPYQGRPQLPNDPKLFEPSPEHDACRLSSYSWNSVESQPEPNSPQVGLASYNRPATGLLPSTGNIKGLIITAAKDNDYATLRENVALRRQWWQDTQTAADQVSNFFWNQSRGRLDVDYTVDRRVIRVGDDVTINGNPLPLPGLDPRHLLQKADSAVDFTGYDFVVMQFAYSPSKRAAAQPRRSPEVLDGNAIRNWHSVYRPPAAPLNAAPIETMAHELGHLLGLPDLYSNAEWYDRFEMQKSLMGTGGTGIGLSGYERWLLGWVPTNQVHCSVPGTDEPGSIIMSSLDNLNTRGIKLLMYPYSTFDGIKDRMRVVELRSNEDTTRNVPGGPGLVSYTINSSCPASDRYVWGLSLSSAYECHEPAFTTWRSSFQSLKPSDEGSAYAAFVASLPADATNAQIDRDVQRWYQSTPEGRAFVAARRRKDIELNPNTLPHDVERGRPGGRPIFGAVLDLWPGVLLTNIVIEEGPQGAIASFNHDPTLRR